jgi:hypothetical protein
VFVLRLPRAALLAGLGAILAGLVPVSPALAQQVLCHYTYGGETRTLAAAPVTSPYAVKAIDVGSYFHFRVVFEDRPAEADGAAVKIYTYADRDDGPLLIHQASYAYPPLDGSVASQRAGGFTGWQFVYEPVRDGELQYWCEYSAVQQPPRATHQAGQGQREAHDA